MSAMTKTKPTCAILRAETTYEGKQGFSYFHGISAESVGAEKICMHLLTIPPGGVRSIVIAVPGWASTPSGTHRADWRLPIVNDPTR